MRKDVLNPKVTAIAPSETLAIAARAKELAAAGRKVFGFAAGEPDFDTPEHIKQAAAKALADGETKYAPVAGLPALRAAIAEKLRRENGLAYDASQVVVTCGAKHALYNVIMALCRDGEEVIVPTPCWLSYPEMIRMAGASPVFVRCREENDFRMTVEEFESAITKRTKAVILNSPSNPIGNVYGRAEIAALAEAAVRRGVYIISDEMYEKLIYDGAEHVSPGAFSPEALAMTVTVNGFSKAYSMTGWRLGYYAGPSELVKAATGLQSHSTSGATTFAQHGALAALTGSQSCVMEMRAAFEARRSRIHELLRAIDGVTCVRPQGAFYALPHISHFGLDSVTFATRLIDEQGVALVPGTPFGAEGYVRLSYACSVETIEGGLERLARFVASLS